jgi:hypothetical protein
VGATSWLRRLSVPRPMLIACGNPCSFVLCGAEDRSTQMNVAFQCTASGENRRTGFDIGSKGKKTLKSGGQDGLTSTSEKDPMQRH